MQLNNYDILYHYTIRGYVLPKIRSYKNLGVIISLYLETTSKYRAAATEDHRVLWATCRSFEY